MLKNDRESQNIAGNSAIESVETEQAICNYISKTLLPPDSGIEVEPGDDLLSIDYLDSMQFMRLVQFTEETYEVSIPPEDLLIENFQTVRRLTEYLSERKVKT